MSTLIHNSIFGHMQLPTEVLESQAPEVDLISRMLVSRAVARLAVAHLAVAHLAAAHLAAAHLAVAHLAVAHLAVAHLAVAHLDVAHPAAHTLRHAYGLRAQGRVMMS